MGRKILVVGLTLALSLAAVFTAIYAATFTGTVTFTCTDFGDTTPGTITFDRDNSGSGSENYRVEVTDGAGTIIFSLSTSRPVSTVTSLGIGVYSTAPQFNPITMTFISEAGNSLPEQIVSVQQGSCAGLPSFAAVGACLPLTDFAVVGSLPLDTQADYAPGQPAAGVMINAGTYWVLGQDESHQFYKILLACQYLWVPVELDAAELSAALAGAGAANGSCRVGEPT